MLELEKTVDKPEERLHELMAYHYGLMLRKVVPAPKGWRLETNRGTFTLSRVERIDETYWRMIDRLLRHLCERGLPQLPRLTLTAQGKTTFSGFHSRYLLWGNAHARNCNWHNLDTWSRIGRTLAHIHRASRDFTPEDAYDRFTAAGKWSELWKRNLMLLDTIRRSYDFSVNQRPADRLWVRVHSYATTMIETALHYLDELGGDDEVQVYMAEGIVGQHDLNRHSWGVNQSGAVTLLDWKQTVLDVRARDVARMIHLAYGDKEMFSERVRLFLLNYQSVHPLTEAEWPLLYVRMLFPERLVKTARDVYEKQTISQKDAPRMLKQAIDDQHKREYHLRYIPRLLKEMAGISIPEVDWLK